MFQPLAPCLFFRELLRHNRVSSSFLLLFFFFFYKNVILTGINRHNLHHLCTNMFTSRGL